VDDAVPREYSWARLRNAAMLDLAAGDSSRGACQLQNLPFFKIRRKQGRVNRKRKPAPSHLTVWNKLSWRRDIAG
jgi:hypothetical protein